MLTSKCDHNSLSHSAFVINFVPLNVILCAVYVIVVLCVLATVPARPGTGIKPTTAYRPGSALKPYAVERLRPGTRQGARQAAAGGGGRPGTGGARPGSGRRAAEATRPGSGSSSSRPGTAQRLGTAGNSFHFANTAL